MPVDDYGDISPFPLTVYVQGLTVTMGLDFIVVSKRQSHLCTSPVHDSPENQMQTECKPETPSD